MALTPAERSKKWRLDHPERVNRWAENNREYRNKYVRDWNKINRKKRTEIEKRWRKKNPRTLKAQLDKYRKENPDKFRAYQALHIAVKFGLVIRPENCQQCNKECKVDGHHHKGYDHPLEVLWLCRQCHVNRHSKS